MELWHIGFPEDIVGSLERIIDWALLDDIREVDRVDEAIDKVDCVLALLGWFFQIGAEQFELLLAPLTRMEHWQFQ